MTNWLTKLNGSEGQNTTDPHYILNRQAAESAADIGFETIHYAPFDLRDASDEALTLQISTLLSGLQANDTLIVQLPMWVADNRFEAKFLELARLIPGIKLAAMVWEVMPWLMTDDISDGSNPDFDFLNRFDLVVAGNTKLANHLRDVGGVTSSILSMDMTDWQTETPDLDTTTVVSGTNSGSFGLVTATSQYDTLTNPLALSQFLAAGLPVVITADMAHAEWVADQNLGIVLEASEDMNQALAALSEADYQAKLAAVRPWSVAIKSGYFTKRACQAVLSMLKLDTDKA